MRHTVVKDTKDEAETLAENLKARRSGLFGPTDVLVSSSLGGVAPFYVSWNDYSTAD